MITPTATAPVAVPSQSSEMNSKGLDYYAPKFVQGWLQSPPKVKHTYKQPVAPRFPSADYADDYTTRSTRKLAGVEPVDPISAACDARNPSPLSREDTAARKNYYWHFKCLTGVELFHSMKQYAELVIHEAAVSAVPNQHHTYLLELPAVREDSPRIAEGDIIFLRGVNHYFQNVTPWQIEATIVGVQKARGLVYVRSDHIGPAMETLPVWIRGLPKHGDELKVQHKCFQVRFAASPAYTMMQQHCLAICAEALKADDSTMRRWLFPELTDVEEFGDNVVKILEEMDHLDFSGSVDGIGSPVGHNTEWKKEAVHIDDMEWHDTGLNDEQKTAITGLVNCHHRVPYLISGPPGTGKTRTLAEAVVQILCQDSDHNVLVCAPSNTAADTIARRILNHIDDSSVMFRLNSNNRSPDEMRIDLHRISRFNAEGSRFDLPPYEELMKFRVVVCSLQDAQILKRAFADNTSIMHAQLNASMTFNPRQDVSDLQILPHWTHLLIDEAAQATEPEVSIPLSVINPYRSETHAFATWDPTVVLCGDQNQLGPNVANPLARHAELDVSLFERLYMREVYHQARREHPDPWEKTEATKPFTALIRNYRSHDQILMYTSSTFYNERLVPMAKDLEPIHWSRLRRHGVPVAFMHHGGVEAWIDQGSSWYNGGEINVIVELIQSLLFQNPRLHPSEIAVITGWREQVWRMRAKLRHVGLGQVDVGNVEAYQGAEFKVTILSTVRSQQRFVEQDIKNAQGFIRQPRRMNVATSRAKELMVVVGNMELLQSDPSWESFLRIAALCDVYEGPALAEIDPTDGVVPFIEQVARSRGHKPANDGILEYEYQASAFASRLVYDADDDVPVSRSSSGTSTSTRAQALLYDTAFPPLGSNPTTQVSAGSMTMSRSSSGSGSGWSNIPRLSENSGW